MDSIPLEILFVVTVIILFGSMELGYRIGNLHPVNLKKEKEKITGTGSAAILGMLGFFLVFAFGMVYSRYDSKRELVREEANLLRTAWLRSDFLPDQDRIKTENLFRQYVDLRLDAASSGDLNKVQELIKESYGLQNEIWDISVENARKDMNSDVAALYIESVNEIINIQAIRVAVGIQARIPPVIWVILYIVIFLGMFCVGYDASVSGSSRRSWVTPIMVISFSLMLTLIASLDRPDSNVLKVSQQPLVELRAWMEEVK